MLNTLTCLGLGGFFICTAFQKRLDGPLLELSERSLTWARKFFSPKETDAGELMVVQQIQAQLRAGRSLDEILELLVKEETLPPVQKKRLLSLLNGHPGKDFLSLFLQRALETGISLLSPLAALQKILFAEKRLRLKARALTSQARAQAEVLSWLPWVLGLGALLVDPAWFWQAIHSSLSWVTWAIAILLVGAGRAWMKNLLAKALAPASQDELLEEQFLPRLIMGMLAQISLGQDLESAIDQAWISMGTEVDRAAFRRAARGENAIAQFHFLYQQALSSGAPLRDDLLRLLDDLHSTAESRWEERIQRLPVVMMAPLFLCFLPGSLLLMAGLLFPILLSF